MKKIIILILIIIIILSAGIFFWLNRKEHNDVVQTSADIDVVELEIKVNLKQDLNVEFGEKVKVSDFIESIDGTIVNDYEINTEKIGDIPVPFEFIDLNNKKRKFEFTLKTVDETPPKIFIGDSYTVKVGYKKNLIDVLFSADEIDGNLTREIIGDYDVNTVGSYNLTYIVTDSSGNKTQKDFVLHVKENTKKDNDKKVYIADIVKNYKTENTKIGIDVSKWEEEVDWNKVKNQGIEFAIIRMGYQTEYDGELVIDPYFIANIEGAKSVGLPVGVYFYSYAKNESQAIEQANWVKENLKGYEIDLPVAFDWESWSSFNTTGMSIYKINKVANTFLEILEKEGYKGMLYGSKSYLERVWYPTKYDVWLAHYTSKTTYEGKYSIWQMTESGRVDGIEDDVDINVMYLDS